MKPDHDDRLADLFSVARDAARPDADLTARVLADAAQVQATASTQQARAPSRRRWFDQAAEAVGGWIAVSGLAAACAVGVLVGAAVPDAVDAATGGTVSGVFGLSSPAGFAGLDPLGWADTAGGE